MVSTKQKSSKNFLENKLFFNKQNFFHQKILKRKKSLPNSRTQIVTTKKIKS